MCKVESALIAAGELAFVAPTMHSIAATVVMVCGILRTVAVKTRFHGVSRRA